MARRRGRGCFARIIGLLLIAVIALVGYMAIEARVVRLEYTDVFLADLPAAFDGTRVLFVADAHIGAFCSGNQAAKLFNDMQSLAPDLLLLGGDYVGADPFTARDVPGAISQRNQFFEALGWFYAPLGKFGVRGNHDAKEGLDVAMAAGGITLLSNQMARLEKDGARLYLAGLDDFSTGSQDYNALAGLVRPGDAVLVLSHSPDAFHAALRLGDWFDMMLSGHTHGGQVSLPVIRNLISPSIYGERYLTGWKREQGALLLVSNGLGSTALPLRFNAPPQVHLLTLRRGLPGLS